MHQNGRLHSLAVSLRVQEVLSAFAQPLGACVAMGNQSVRRVKLAHNAMLCMWSSLTAAQTLLASSADSQIAKHAAVHVTLLVASGLAC